MTESLFTRDVGVTVGERFIDIAMEKAAVPDPMLEVKVAEIDETGMIHLVSAIFDGSKRVVVSRGALDARFRRK